MTDCSKNRIQIAFFIIHSPQIFKCRNIADEANVSHGRETGYKKKKKNFFLFFYVRFFFFLYSKQKKMLME